MEAQTLPDAVNHKGFGDIILDKGHSVNYEIGFNTLIHQDNHVLVKF